MVWVTVIPHSNIFFSDVNISWHWRLVNVIEKFKYKRIDILPLLLWIICNKKTSKLYYGQKTWVNFLQIIIVIIIITNNIIIISQYIRTHYFYKFWPYLRCLSCRYDKYSLRGDIVYLKWTNKRTNQQIIRWYTILNLPPIVEI